MNRREERCVRRRIGGGANRHRILQLGRVLMILVGRNRGDNFRLGVDARILDCLAGHERIEILAGAVIDGCRIVNIGVLVQLFVRGNRARIDLAALERGCGFGFDYLALVVEREPQRMLGVGGHRFDLAAVLGRPTRADRYADSSAPRSAREPRPGPACRAPRSRRRERRRSRYSTRPSTRKSRAGLLDPNPPSAVTAAISYLVILVGADDVLQFRYRVGAVNMDERRHLGFALRGPVIAIVGIGIRRDKMYQCRNCGPRVASHLVERLYCVLSGSGVVGTGVEHLGQYRQEAVMTGVDVRQRQGCLLRGLCVSALQSDIQFVAQRLWRQARILLTLP